MYIKNNRFYSPLNPFYSSDLFFFFAAAFVSDLFSLNVWNDTRLLAAKTVTCLLTLHKYDLNTIYIDTRLHDCWAHAYARTRSAVSFTPYISNMHVLYRPSTQARKLISTMRIRVWLVRCCDCSSASCLPLPCQPTSFPLSSPRRVSFS